MKFCGFPLLIVLQADGLTTGGLCDDFLMSSCYLKVFLMWIDYKILNIDDCYFGFLFFVGFIKMRCNILEHLSMSKGTCAVLSDESTHFNIFYCSIKLFPL